MRDKYWGSYVLREMRYDLMRAGADEIAKAAVVVVATFAAVQLFARVVAFLMAVMGL